MLFVITFTPDFYKRSIFDNKTNNENLCKVHINLCFADAIIQHERQCFELYKRFFCFYLLYFRILSTNRTKTSLNGDISYHNHLQALSVSDVELGNKPISELYSSSHNQRLRRGIEVVDFLRDILQKLCLRENLLFLDKSKSFHSDKDPIYAQSSCEYHIFALRRILI